MQTITTAELFFVAGTYGNELAPIYLVEEFERSPLSRSVTNDAGLFYHKPVRDFAKV